MAEQEQHTPGPWGVIAALKPDPDTDRLDYLITDGGGATAGLHIAEVFAYQHDDRPDGPAKANARLIAAAPAMLEALERIAKMGIDSPRLAIPGAIANDAAHIARSQS